jgi:hypothetical protein
MDKIPVAMITYNRPDMLRNALAEQHRTLTPFPIDIYDDGSNDQKKLDLLKTISDCTVHNMKHLGHRKQVLEIMKEMNTAGVRYFAFIEDDAIFSINWYTWGVNKLHELESNGHKVGALALYTGHARMDTRAVIPGVYKHNREHFYGSCCIFFNTTITSSLINQVNAGFNPDVALRELSVNNVIDLFVTTPTVAEHIGTESLLGAPPHRSNNFYGQDVDMLK